MFSRILIASRGEIALRIIRACKELGIQSVVAYSEADAGSLYLDFADASICIGPADASQSYLNIAHIIAADRHRVAVFQEAPGRYVVVANSHEALSAAERLLLQLGGRKVRVPVRPEEAYEALLKWYSSAWGLSGRRVLEERIERVSRERGVSREQAILALYEEELGAAG